MCGYAVKYYLRSIFKSNTPIMKIQSLIILFTVLGTSLYAQKTEIIKINTQSSGLLYKRGYLYETFTDGKLYYKDGTHSNAKLNFNGMTNEMLFISPKGDTLAFAHPEQASIVVIGTDTFSYFDNTFLKKLTHNEGTMNVFQKQELRFMNSETTTPYGSSGISSSTQGGSLSNIGGPGRTGSTAFADARVLVFKKSTSLYISDNSGKMFPSKQGTFYKLFPNDKDKLNAFIKEQRINFSDEADVAKLIDFVAGFKASNPE